MGVSLIVSLSFLNMFFPLLSLIAVFLWVRTSLGGGVTVTTSDERQTCIVSANGGQVDDVPNIMEAFTTCGSGGRIVFPANQNYWIATRLNPTFYDVAIDWQGQWTVQALPLL